MAGRHRRMGCEPAFRAREIPSGRALGAVGMRLSGSPAPIALEAAQFGSSRMPMGRIATRAARVTRTAECVLYPWFRPVPRKAGVYRSPGPRDPTTADLGPSHRRCRSSGHGRRARGLADGDEQRTQQARRRRIAHMSRRSARRRRQQGEPGVANEAAFCWTLTDRLGRVDQMTSAPPTAGSSLDARGTSALDGGTPKAALGVAARGRCLAALVGLPDERLGARHRAVVAHLQPDHDRRPDRDRPVRTPLGRFRRAGRGESAVAAACPLTAVRADAGDERGRPGQAGPAAFRDRSAQRGGPSSGGCLQLDARQAGERPARGVAHRAGGTGGGAAARRAGAP